MPDKNHEQNRRRWDEIVDIHYHHPDYHLKEFLAGWNSLKPIEREFLGDVTGRRLLHLFCQFGQDTLSWARLGAGVTGVDISDRSIALAEQLKSETGLSGTFVRSDVLDLKGQLDGRFDIVFQSYGTHMWISNLERWAEVIAHYLKPGGVFLLVDGHPVGQALLDDGVRYFDAQPTRYDSDPDYCDRSYVPKEASIEWHHTLGAIVNALIGAGLTISRLEEYDHMYYRRGEDWVERDSYWYPPDGAPNYPLMMALLATR